MKRCESWKNHGAEDRAECVHALLRELPALVVVGQCVKIEKLSNDQRVQIAVKRIHQARQQKLPAKIKQNKQ